MSFKQKTEKASEYPKYIDFPNDTVMPLPGIAKQVLIYSFLVDADYSKLQDICNNRLNIFPESLNIKFTPLSNKVLIVTSKFFEGKTKNLDYSKPGELIENSIQIFIPVLQCHKNTKNVWKGFSLFLFAPYIFVDNDISLVAGREQLGFPKVLGRFTLPNDAQKVDYISVQAFGFKQFNRHNPDKSEWNDLMKITMKNTSSSVEQKKFDKLKIGKDILGSLKELFLENANSDDYKVGFQFFINQVSNALSKKVNMVFLKQFRDVADPSKACYQAIIESSGYVEKIHDGGYLNDQYQLEISEFASFPLMNDFGWKEINPISKAFWVKCDLVFECGKEIWKA